MKRIAVSDLKNRLSEYLRLVKRGETIEILERSVPIARIEALPPGASSGKDRLARLVDDGVVQRPKRKRDLRFLQAPPVPCSGGAVEALIEERGDR